MKKLIIVLLVAVIMTSSVFTALAVEQVSNSEMMEMCDRVDGFMNTYERVPQIVYTDSDQTNSVTAAEFYYMMARWLRFYRANSRVPETVTITRSTGAPPAPTGVESGTLYQAELLNRAKDNADFIDSNSRLPNYTQLDSGAQLTPEAFFWVMARTINFYQDNGRLPNYTEVQGAIAPNSWTGGDSNSPTPPDQYPWSKTFSVPYTAQPDSYTCGPTSLRMAMAYYGTFYGVSTISNYMASIGDSPYNDGVSASTVAAAASHYGFNGRTTRYGWQELKNAIQANKPCIANIYISANNYPKYYPSGSPAYTVYTGGHFVVVCGLKADASGNVLYVIVNDPSRGSGIKYTYSSWESAWAGRNRLFITLE
jgi:hypothetical protein